MSQVQHPEHGPGEVVTYRRDGRVAIVDFQSRPMPTHVSTRELVQIDGEADDRRSADVENLLPDEAPALEGTRGRRRSSRVLEAMRLGVVPDRQLDPYTVGRDVELSRVEADLSRVESGDGAVRAFLGDYGTGKTHLLRTIRERAVEAGYLVADVTLDPRETPPSHPKRVYRDIVQSLAYPDADAGRNGGLRPLFDRAADSDQVREQFDVRPGKGDRDARLEAGMHLYLTPALLYYDQLTDDDLPEHLDGVPSDDAAAFATEARSLLFEWIEGYPTMSNREINDRLGTIEGGHPWLYSLMDYRPWSRIYGYLLSGIATLARAVGYPGLIVLVDEAERYAVLSKENRDFARYLFKALSVASVGADAVPFDHSELTSLGGIGVLKELPPRYGDSPGLYTVLAMTPHREGEAALKEAIPPGKTCELAPFDDRDYAELASKVCDFYASAHPDWALPETFVTRATGMLEDARSGGFVATPRAAMKFLVELLDIARLSPDQLERVARSIDERSTTFRA